jgi:ABC-type multidrug transport system permease subunit
MKSPKILENAEKFEQEYDKNYKSNIDFSKIFNNFKLYKNKLFYIYLGIFILMLYLLHNYTPDFIIKKQIIYIKTSNDNKPQIDYTELLKYTIIFSLILFCAFIYFSNTNNKLYELIYN